MKRTDYLTHLHSLSLADIKKEAQELEKKMQQETMALRFGKSKQVRNLRNLRTNLAQCLTIANAKLREASEGEK